MEMDDYESLPENMSSSIHMMAGASAGIMEHCVMYPLDVVKTRMQSLSPNPRAVYRSVPEALVKMVKHEGVFRPFKGMSIMVVGAGPAHAMYFSCYEKMKRVFSGTKDGSHNPLAQGAAGSLSTLLHDAVMVPADVVKQRLQVYGSPYSSVIHCIRDVYKREGISAFYRSYGTQLTMNIPFQAMMFVMYEAMIELTNKERQYNPKAHMVSGAVAGAVAAAVTNPLDVCKTLLNTQEPLLAVSGSSSLKTSPRGQIRGLFQAASTIYSCCGSRGFFQGLQARVMYTMPSTAIAWSVYELFKYLLNSRRSGGTGHSASMTNLSGSSSSLSSSPPSLLVHHPGHHHISNPLVMTSNCDHHRPVIKETV